MCLKEWKCVRQAVEKLDEKAVVVVGREEDAAAVKEATEAAKSKYKQTFQHEAPTITVSNDTFLPSGSKGKDEDEVTWSAPSPWLGCQSTAAHGSMETLRLAYYSRCRLHIAEVSYVDTPLGEEMGVLNSFAAVLVEWR